MWAPDTVLAAPELLDIEVLNALRRLDQAGAIPATRKAGLPGFLQSLRIRKYRHARMSKNIWALRNNLSAYDAAYVVLARMLDATLVTRDQRLASAPGLSIEVVTP